MAKAENIPARAQPSLKGNTPRYFGDNKAKREPMGGRTKACGNEKKGK